LPQRLTFDRYGGGIGSAITFVVTNADRRGSAITFVVTNADRRAAGPYLVQNRLW
jgi:hypothetical protein